MATMQPPFISGTYLRGIRGYDVKTAYNLLLRNATVEGGTRPYITEYMTKGYISEPDLKKPVVATKAKAAVTKTLEYSYDDYAVAQLAKELGDTSNYAMLMKRSSNYKNMFDPTTELMRGRLANGEWIKDFDPEYPYYEYMYREANAWQSSFFAPHDVQGLIGLYKSKDDFEKKLDDLFSIPWKGIEADNLSVFIGQYCHGNQPDHNFPFMYYFVDKQEKSQPILNHIMDHFYDMGKYKLAYAGMDDAGEMSSWYVFNAMGIYPFSPADEDYIISVPIFDKVAITLGENVRFTIARVNTGNKISNITYDGRKLDGYFIPHHEIMRRETDDGYHAVAPTGRYVIHPPGRVPDMIPRENQSAMKSRSRTFHLAVVIFLAASARMPATRHCREARPRRKAFHRKPLGISL